MPSGRSSTDVAFSFTILPSILYTLAGLLSLPKVMLLMPVVSLTSFRLLGQLADTGSKLYCEE